MTTDDIAASGCVSALGALQRPVDDEPVHDPERTVPSAWAVVVCILGFAACMAAAYFLNGR